MVIFLMKIMQKWSKKEVVAGKSDGEKWKIEGKKSEKMKNFVIVAMNFRNDFIHSSWQRDKEINRSQEIPN